MADKHMDKPEERGFKAEARRVFSAYEYPRTAIGTISREMMSGATLKTASGFHVAAPIMISGTVLGAIVGIGISGETLNLRGENNRSPIAYGLQNDFGYEALQIAPDKTLVLVRDHDHYRAFRVTEKSGEREWTYIPDPNAAFFEVATATQALQEYSAFLRNINGTAPTMPPSLMRYDYISTLYQDPNSEEYQRSVSAAQAVNPAQGQLVAHYETAIQSWRNAAENIRDGAYGFDADGLPSDTTKIENQRQMHFLQGFLVPTIMAAALTLGIGLPIGAVRSGNALYRRRRNKQSPKLD